MLDRIVFRKSGSLSDPRDSSSRKNSMIDQIGSQKSGILSDPRQFFTQRAPSRQPKTHFCPVHLPQKQMKSRILCPEAAEKRAAANSSAHFPRKQAKKSRWMGQKSSFIRREENFIRNQPPNPTTPSPESKYRSKPPCPGISFHSVYLFPGISFFPYFIPPDMPSAHRRSPSAPRAFLPL